MIRWLTGALVAVLVLGPAAHATCRCCDVPAQSDCHRGSTGPVHGARGTQQDPGSRPSDCNCPTTHLVCVDSTRPTIVEPTRAPHPSAAPLQAVVPVRLDARTDDAERFAWMSRGSPPRAHVPLHLALHVLLI